MSYLKTKSEFNISGAELLIKSGLYAPSIHCSYYSVFQLMKTVYCSKSNITFEEYSSEVKNQNGSSHNILIRNFCDLLEDRKDKRDFKRTIDDLKASRIKSDYDNFQIDSEISSRALNKAKELLLKAKRI